MRRVVRLDLVLMVQQVQVELVAAVPEVVVFPRIVGLVQETVLLEVLYRQERHFRPVAMG